jgi:hypothetical protein
VSETKISAIPTHVSASIDKDGRGRSAHIAVRHKKVTFTENVGHEHETPLDCFIEKHGGATHLRETLEKMEGHERAKLLDAMAHVEGTDAAAVMKKLGIHEPEKSELTELIQEETVLDNAKKAIIEKLAEAKGAGVITADEHTVLSDTLERDGVQAAIDAAAALRSQETEAAVTAPPISATASAEAAEGGAGLRASLLAQADALYQRHVDAANQAQRAKWTVEKRQIRGWRVPAQIADAPAEYAAQAEKHLQEWRAFCDANGLTESLS